MLRNSISTSQKCFDSQNSNEIPRASSKHIGLKVFIATLTGVGFGIGLVKYNNDIREKVESNVPYSDVLFKQIDFLFDNYIYKKP